jgi:hypothetical protein
MSKLRVFWLSVAAVAISAATGCYEGGGADVTPEELIAKVDGQNFASWAELEAALSSRGYDFSVSEPEEPYLLPKIKAKEPEMSDVEKGYYIILQQSESMKVYRLVVYTTPQGFYVQDDTGVKNPYQT